MTTWRRLLDGSSIAHLACARVGLFPGVVLERHVPEDDLERLLALEVDRQPAGTFREGGRCDLEGPDRGACRRQGAGAELEPHMSAPGTAGDLHPGETIGGQLAGLRLQVARDGDCRRRWRRPRVSTVAVGAAGEAVAAAEGAGVTAAVDGDALGVVGPQAAMDSPRITRITMGRRRVAWLKTSSEDWERSGRTRRSGRAPARRGSSPAAPLPTAL